MKTYGFTSGCFRETSSSLKTDAPFKTPDLRPWLFPDASGKAQTPLVGLNRSEDLFGFKE